MINRINSLRKKLDDFQAIIVTSPSNRIYLTGFRSSAGTIFITKNSASFFIDFRYFEKAKNVITDLNVVLSSNLYSEINEIIDKENIKEIYVETANTTVLEFGLLSKHINATILSDDTINSHIMKMRSIKNDKELSLIKQAQFFTDETFNYILSRIEKGRTEKDIMLDLEFFLRKMGAERVSFNSIVVAGKNTSLPHGTPGDYTIQNGDFITMDFGAIYGGYCSDMTRTVAVGKISEEQEFVYKTVLRAQSEAIKSILPGKVCKDIDSVARNIIYNEGFEGCFGHSLGHSIGIDVHESPGFSTRCNDLLETGMVITVEPGIYIENKFGVRIEDMIVVTQNGCENLTHSPKNLIIV